MAKQCLFGDVKDISRSRGPVAGLLPPRTGLCSRSVYVRFVVVNETGFYPSTAELHLSVLTGTVSRPDMQNIRMTGFFFENRIHSQSDVEENPTNGCFRLHNYLCTNKTLILNSLYVFDNWAKNFKPKKKDVIQLQ